MIRVNSRRCLLYWQTFVLYRSDNKANEVPPLRARPYVTSTASNFGTFCSSAKRRATASAFISVTESVCEHGVSGSFQRNFRETSYLEFVLNSVDIFRYLLKLDKGDRHIKGKPTYIVVTRVYYGDVFTVKYGSRPKTQLTVSIFRLRHAMA